MIIDIIYINPTDDLSEREEVQYWVDASGENTIVVTANAGVATIALRARSGDARCVAVPLEERFCDNLGVGLLVI